MAYLAIYRKYRPTTFDKVIGQEHVVKTLINQIETGRIGHAYLFTGTRGTGKTSIAKIFSKAINCLNPVNGSPCGKCLACQSLSDPSNIDVLEIDAASNNGVNEIRDLREKVQYPPTSCKYKVYIIDEVHMLSPSAFNALLKTLEEPPKHAVFILATTEVHKMPATILSRCMRFDFKLVDIDTIANLICSIYDELGKKYDKDAVYMIAKSGEGSVRDALSVADTCLSFAEGKLTYQDVLTAIGSSDREKLSALLQGVLSDNSEKALTVTDSLLKLGKSVGLLLKDVAGYLRELLIVKTCQNAKELLKLPKEMIDELEQIASTVTKEKILRALEIFTLTESDLKYSSHPRILFETAVVKATKPDEDNDISALLTRIAELEKTVKDLKNGAISLPTKKKEVNLEEPKCEVKEDVRAVEEIKEVKPVTLTPVSKTGLTAGQIFGKIVTSLRHNNEVMLWSVMQGASAKLDGDTLTVIASGEGDEEVIGTEENIKLIKNQLPEYSFSVVVKRSPEVENKNKIDEEIENYKKIFGSDIVIIK
ncbi:MAG: DNA polymerase III subunit gamma/tau [Clostridia bacterium]|nr:DNA polymerase III subunit gamma/tau [Clostridia bacterium]